MEAETAAPTHRPEAHVGRQPIYDRDGAVVGYELLFRAGSDASDAARADGHATARVLVAAFTALREWLAEHAEFGLEELTGGRVAFLNVTREFLTGLLPLPFDDSQAVLEVLRTVEVDDELVAGVTVLVERGFTLALDDYVAGTGRDALLPLVSYVKIDLPGADESTVRDTVELCRRHSHLQLVAQRLESADNLRLAFELGFDLFQGHILGRPHVDSTVALTPGRFARLRVLAALTSDDVDLDEVVGMVSQDAGLSLRLLRSTNAAAFGLNRTVSSVREGVVAMGLNRFAAVGHADAGRGHGHRRPGAVEPHPRPGPALPQTRRGRRRPARRGVPRWTPGGGRRSLRRAGGAGDRRPAAERGRGPGADHRCGAARRGAERRRGVHRAGAGAPARRVRHADRRPGRDGGRLPCRAALDEHRPAGAVPGG